MYYEPGKTPHNLPYDPFKSCVVPRPIGWISTLAEMIQANKGKSEPLNLATFGAGSPGHFGASEFGEQAGIRVEPVHFRSTGDAITAIVSGQVSVAWVSTAVASAQIKGGRMRGLATQHLRALPFCKTCRPRRKRACHNYGFPLGLAC